MKILLISILTFASLSSFSGELPGRLPKSMVCVKSVDGMNLILVLTLSPNEGVIPNYDLTYIANGKVFLNFETALVVDKLSDDLFMVKGYINEPQRSDVLGYAGYQKSRGGFYYEAANDGMSPMPGRNFSDCKLSY